MVQMTGFICSLKKGLDVNSITWHAIGITCESYYCAHVRDYNFVHKCKGADSYLFQRVKVIFFC